MLYFVSETGNKLDITKGYYYDICNMKKNTTTKKELMVTMEDINEKITETKYKKTLVLEEYMKYIELVHNNWEKIWNFYASDAVLKLNYKKYKDKKQGIKRIINKILPKDNKIRWQKYKPVCETSANGDKIITNKLEKLPKLFIIGKGNGNLTVSNVKGVSQKGAIKKVVYEISKRALVLLQDEHRTSMLCNECNELIVHPKFVKKKENKIKKEENYNQRNHKLCVCTNTINHEGKHKLWNRDYNAAVNILIVGIRTLLNKDLGNFSRNRELRSNKTKYTQDRDKKMIKGKLKTIYKNLMNIEIDV